MLEGKEVEKQLGEYGNVFVDVKPNGDVEVGATAKINVFAELRKLAKRTDNKLDDAAIDYIEKLASLAP